MPKILRFSVLCLALGVVACSDKPKAGPVVPADVPGVSPQKDAKGKITLPQPPTATAAP